MKKLLLYCLILIMSLGNTSLVLAECGPTTASQTVTATLTRPVVPPPGPGPNPGIAVGVGVGAPAAAAAGAFAFAPLLLAGLTPNGVICAAAPIDCIPCQDCLLQTAIMNHFGTTDLAAATAAMKCDCNKLYIAQVNTAIKNGTYDLQSVPLPADFLKAKLKITITMASDPLKETCGEPDLAFGLYRNITPCDLRKKFETQQFLHYYMMKKYTIPVRAVQKDYCKGYQKLVTIVDLRGDNSSLPIQTVVKYTENGFSKNQLRMNPKVKFYAYLMEIEKVS